MNACCNQSCVWCYNMAKLNDSQQMSEDTFNNILEHLVMSGCKGILLVGGEPTLHPLLPHFITRAIEAGIPKIWIVSNGYRIHGNFFDALEGFQSNVIINISIHGSNQAIHDKLTQRIGSFNALLSNIDAYHEHGFIVNGQTTLCMSNQGDILNILSVLEKKNIGNILVSYCMKPIGVRTDCKEFITVNDFCECIVSAVNRYAGGIHIDVAPHMPRCMMSARFLELLDNEQIGINHGCGFNKNEIIFDPYGNILLCIHLPDVVMGNIKEISDFSSFIQEINTKVHSYRRYPLRKCGDCNSIKQCTGGGCPVLWLTNKVK